MATKRNPTIIYDYIWRVVYYYDWESEIYNENFAEENQEFEFKMK